MPPSPDDPGLDPIALPAPGVPVVGLGASAGGLEPLSLFLRLLPAASGLAYVVVQHMEPNRKGVLAELLQRDTAMPVVWIGEGTRVQADHVYVMPPNSDLRLARGVFQLRSPSALPGVRHPIDVFFRSLADDQGTRAVGIVLSGMGADGTLGLRAIKDAGGQALVQSPETARYDSMPLSAIHEGAADFVGSIQDLARRVIAPREAPTLADSPGGTAPTDAEEGELDQVLLLLRARTGQDFSLYKKSTLLRRVQRRLAAHQLTGIPEYLDYLQQEPEEAEKLIGELLIGVTRFFRDAAVWNQLAEVVLPRLFQEHPEGASFRAWVPGCSTGEEAYSLAILFREVLERHAPVARYTLQIFATDLDPVAIESARKGLYRESIAGDLSPERLKRGFLPENGRYRLRKDIRDMVVFAVHNLVMDPPFTRLDLVSCRNLLIYLEASLQKRLLTMMHYSLNPGGVLVLGSSETIGSLGDLFEALPGKTRIYRKRLADSLLLPAGQLPAARPSAPHAAIAKLPQAPSAGAGASLPAHLQDVMQTLLMRDYGPPAVLADASGDIVYVTGKTGRYLEPAAGHATLNLFAMAREGLSAVLSSAFAEALRTRAPVTVPAVEISEGQGAVLLDLAVQPLREPEALAGLVLVVFLPAGERRARATSRGRASAAQGAQLEQLVRDLRLAREELSETRARMQAAQEELRSTNEELQSTNEELQSANEELTTSREESQSMNEELQTINQELQAKVDELYRTGDDLRNLLNSTDIATLFLDESLKVRSFTTQTLEIIKLIPSDIGRPVTDLVTQLNYPELARDVREVLRTLMPQEHQVSASQGRWFSVRLMPYRTQDNRIDGVVLTFLDITAGKCLEVSLRDALDLLQKRFDALGPEAVADASEVLRKAELALAELARGRGPTPGP